MPTKYMVSIEYEEFFADGNTIEEALSDVALQLGYENFTRMVIEEDLDIYTDIIVYKYYTDVKRYIAQEVNFEDYMEG